MNNLSEVKRENYKLFFVDKLAYLMEHNPKVWSWHTGHIVRDGEQFLNFKIKDHLLKGYVTIGLNGMDMFDVFVTTELGYTIEKIESIYDGDLVSVIDERIKNINRSNNI